MSPVSGVDVLVIGGRHSPSALVSERDAIWLDTVSGTLEESTVAVACSASCLDASHFLRPILEAR